MSKKNIPGPKRASFGPSCFSLIPPLNENGPPTRVCSEGGVSGHCGCRLYLRSYKTVRKKKIKLKRNAPGPKRALFGPTNPSPPSWSPLLSYDVALLSLSSSCDVALSLSSSCDVALALSSCKGPFRWEWVWGKGDGV